MVKITLKEFIDSYLDSLSRISNLFIWEKSYPMPTNIHFDNALVGHNKDILDRYGKNIVVRVGFDDEGLMITLEETLP